MLNDLKGKAVLITGGTKGIGLATGLAFGQAGAPSAGRRMAFGWTAGQSRILARRPPKAGGYPPKAGGCPLKGGGMRELFGGSPPVILRAPRKSGGCPKLLSGIRKMTGSYAPMNLQVPPKLCGLPRRSGGQAILFCEQPSASDSHCRMCQWVGRKFGPLL